MHLTFCLMIEKFSTLMITCRDHASDILFDDRGEDQPIPAYILEALLKVSDPPDIWYCDSGIVLTEVDSM